MSRGSIDIFSDQFHISGARPSLGDKGSGSTPGRVAKIADFVGRVPCLALIIEISAFFPKIKFVSYPIFDDVVRPAILATAFPFSLRRPGTVIRDLLARIVGARHKVRLPFFNAHCLPHHIFDGCMKRDAFLFVA